MAGNSSIQAAILEILREAGGKPLNHKQVSRRLPPELFDQQPHVPAWLEQMATQGQIKMLERGKYYLQPELHTVRGKLEVTRSGDGWILQEEGDDVFVPKAKRNRSLPGDIVEARVRPAKRKESVGEVMRILQRHRGPYIGVLDIFRNHVFLLADNQKLGVDILVDMKADESLDGHKAVVEITDWPEHRRNPQGKLLHLLGKPGDNDTEMHAIVAEFGFPLAFLPATDAHCAEIPEVIAEAEMKKRRDFRQVLTFTIDPADAKDFDDAISFRRLENGNVEIGVHIADVSHYVQDGDPIDLEAAQRGTSVYLVDRTIPMLPEKLSNNLCSLRPRENRLAFSAVFELDEHAVVQQRWFGKTVIYSDRRFTYEEAQQVLETGEGDFVEELTEVNRLAKILNEERMKSGSVNFETTEVRFKLDAQGRPVGIMVKQRKDAHKLIEEFMLLANREVAFHIHERNRQTGRSPFIYRVHDLPQEDKLNDLMLMCRKFGYSLQVDNEKVLKRDLNRLMAQIAGKPEEALLQNMAVRSMAKAVYTGQKTSHFGLGFAHYTHFTSPIRRYPDLLAHRLLQHYLEGKAATASYTAQRIEQLAKHSSNMENQAAEAERASIRYKMAEYLETQVGEEYEGVISGLTDWGIYVELVENKCEGMVRIPSLKDDQYMYHQKEQAVVGRRTGNTYVFGQRVRVKVKAASRESRQIDFFMVES
ncbi:MAG: ribonuclease R [Bacteroidetes bacterium]|nr:ribonuclease R [Bacteroidota bacterium]